MEYVDGEELASLLRRVGRLSSERSVELAPADVRRAGRGARARRAPQRPEACQRDERWNILFALVAVNLLVRRMWVTARLDGGQRDRVMLRFGLLSMLTLFVVNFLLISSAPTLDPSKWFFSTSLMLLFLIVSVLGVYGFYA